MATAARAAKAVVLAALLAIPTPGFAEGPKSGAGPAFHPAASDAERALDAIIHKADKDPALFAFAIKAPWRKKALDAGYAKDFSPALQKAWESEEKAAVKENCGGKYLDGEVCGLEGSPITCAQDESGEGYVYRTVKSDATTATIDMAWPGRDEVVGSYRMILVKGRWILDGVRCGGEGSGSHWK